MRVKAKQVPDLFAKELAERLGLTPFEVRSVVGAALSASGCVLIVRPVPKEKP